MATVGFTNIAAALAPLRKAAKALEKRAIVETRVAGILAITTAMNKTPVWQGETVRNYRFGRDGVLPVGKLSAIGGMDPGPTNSMGPAPAGEPRRAANEAAAIGAAFKVLTARKLTSFVLTNTIDADKWDLIDNGSAPGGKDQARRGPGGVSRLAAQAVRMQTGGLWK